MRSGSGDEATAITVRTAGALHVRPRLRTQAGQQAEATGLALRQGRDQRRFVEGSTVQYRGSVPVFIGRPCDGGIRPGQLRLVNLLHLRKSRGNEDEAQNPDDRQETWPEVFFYPHLHHFHLPCPHRILLRRRRRWESQDGVS